LHGERAPELVDGVGGLLDATLVGELAEDHGERAQAQVVRRRRGEGAPERRLLVGEAHGRFVGRLDEPNVPDAADEPEIAAGPCAVREAPSPPAAIGLDPEVERGEREVRSGLEDVSPLQAA
jgi:hypothetical protein